MNRWVRLTLSIVLCLLAVSILFVPAATPTVAQSDCTDKIAQAGDLLQEAQDALAEGDNGIALEKVQEAEALLLECTPSAQPTRPSLRRTPTPRAGATGATATFVSTKSVIPFTFNYPARNSKNERWLVVELDNRLVIANGVQASLKVVQERAPSAGEMWMTLSISNSRLTGNLGTALERVMAASDVYKNERRTRPVVVKLTNGRSLAYIDVTRLNRRVVLWDVEGKATALGIMSALTTEFRVHMPNVLLIANSLKLTN
jgi:hypothetical protein